jgi:hypothetical protein
VADQVTEPSNVDSRRSCRCPISGGQGGDSGQVVGEDPLSGPGFGSFEAVQAGTVPAVSAFEGADPVFASGSPFDGSAECSALLDVLAGGTGPAFARYDNSADPELGQCLVGGRFAVTRSAVTVRGTRPVRALIRRIAGANCGASAGVSGTHPVIHDDAVVVVDDLPL